MKRNILLFLAFFVVIILAVNGTKRILSLRGTSQKVVEAQEKLEGLKQENEDLRGELTYKKSGRFMEEEIRNKLGLARRGEEVFIVPKEESSQQSAVSSQQDEKPNWQKWRDLLLGRS